MLNAQTGDVIKRVADLERRPRRRDALRLLRDERADLREPPRDHGRGGLGVRRPRLRHGLPDERPLSRVGEPGLVDPAVGDGWRRVSRIVGGGVTWTPVTIDTKTNTVYYGTGSATPLYFPAWRPGSAPRTDSLDRGRPAHREAEVVAAADGAQRMVVRHGAAAARLRRQGRRQEAARRLRRDDGGRLVLLRRRERPADLPARQGDRPHRASAAAAGQARRRVPRVDRRPQLLAGGLRPEDELHLQRGVRDGERDDPEEADADAEAAEAPPGRHLPRAPERRLRLVSARLARPRIDQRDRREHRDGASGSS